MNAGGFVVENKIVYLLLCSMVELEGAPSGSIVRELYVAGLGWTVPLGLYRTWG